MPITTRQVSLYLPILSSRLKLRPSPHIGHPERPYRDRSVVPKLTHFEIVGELWFCGVLDLCLRWDVRYRASVPENIDPENLDIEESFARLHECLANGDANGVQDAIFGLSPINYSWKPIPDEVVERLLTLLRSEQMYKSHLAGHVLNYFVFESPRLSPRQKWLCIGFLNAHGDEFVHVHSCVVVADLRYGDYLK